MTESAIVKVRVKYGRDGQGYYTTIYGNGEEGSRSQGYGVVCDPSVLPTTARSNLTAASLAAERDYPDVPVETDDAWPPTD